MLSRPSRYQLVLIFCSACNRPASVPDLAAHLPPLSELRGVTLGMRAWTLTSQRPRAAAAPYAGFRETIGPYAVLYEVPGSVEDGQAPPGWERLESVTVSQSLPSTDSAVHRWRVETSRMSAALHASPQCYSATSASRSDWGAVWSRPGAEVFILAHSLRSSVEREQAWIDFGVAPSAEHVRGIFGLRFVKACDPGIRAPAG